MAIPDSRFPIPELLNLFDYEREAERRIPPAHWGYIAGGANDEVTLGANRAAFDRIMIRYRTMVDVSTRDLRTTVLGVPEGSVKRVSEPSL